MIKRSSIIKKFEPDLLTKYQGKLLPSHKKALCAMADRRTSRSLRMLTSCVDINVVTVTALIAKTTKVNSG
jgi:hypothetical protein